MHLNTLKAKENGFVTDLKPGDADYCVVGTGVDSQKLKLDSKNLFCCNAVNLFCGDVAKGPKPPLSVVG